MIPLYIAIFIVSFLVLSWSGQWLVSALMNIAKYFGWREFVVSFFLIAFASSLPNFAVGITSALRGIPELSFGDVVGGNVVDLSLAIALVVLVSRASLPATASALQASALWTSIIAVLPLILLLDSRLSRADGVILILSFVFYVVWLFSKGERFKKPYNGSVEQPPVKEFKKFFKDLRNLIFGVLFLILGAQGVVSSSAAVASELGMPLPVIGILVIGLGNSLPEIYFAIASARRGKTEMILGDLMGSVIVPATLVLGSVVLIHPINLPDFSPFAVARIFLIISAVLFFAAAKTGRKITKREAVQLFLLYLIFVAVEILTK